MTRNAIIVLIIIILLIIFGVYYWADSQPNPDAVPQDGTDILGETAEPEQPVVSTRGASLISRSSAVLGGEVNPKGAQTSYWYEYGETDDFGNSTSVQLLGAGFLAYDAPGVVTGLKAGTTYYYRLGAQNQYGKVYGATASFKTDLETLPPQYLLPSIETRSASNLTETSATVAGTINPRGSETRYWFEYGENFALGHTTSSASAGAGQGSAAVSANLSGLKENQIYYFRLNAQNAYGTVNGNIAVFVTEQNEPSDSLGEEPSVSTAAATGVGRTNATLVGQVNPNGAATAYRFEYGESTIFGVFDLDKATATADAGKGTGIVSITRAISGLKPDTVYYYRLVAENEFGETNGSIYSFTTKE